MHSALSIVLAYRDRDLPRVRRCLESLGHQTTSSFEVLFVDYGSRPVRAAEARRLVEGFPFTTYLYSETRGHPWNRSQALNIGVRRARGEYVMTSDLDMLFRRDFVAVVLERAGRKRMLHCRAHLLPRGFRDWTEPERHAAGLPRTGPSALGGCQVVPREVFHRLRGFDEYYRYWGVEDRDLHHRLLSAGLEEEWIDDRTALFHQWHPQADVKTPGFLPAGLWGRMEVHFHEAKGEPVRNDADWGRLLTRDDRPALDFLDPETGRPSYRERNRGCLVRLELPHYDPRSVGHAVRAFWELEPGQALLLSGADLPRRRRWLDLALGAANRLLRAAGTETEVGYRFNALHTFVAELVHEGPPVLDDYYLGEAAGQSVSLLVRGEGAGTP